MLFFRFLNLIIFKIYKKLKVKKNEKMIFKKIKILILNFKFLKLTILLKNIINYNND